MPKKNLPISTTEDKIKPFVWREHWIPFTEFEGCQYLILDCDPGKNGTYGQVFLKSFLFAQGFHAILSCSSYTPVLTNSSLLVCLLTQA